MRRFCFGWKRQLGTVTLILTCMLTVGWVRSLRDRDTIDSRQFIETSRGLLFESHDSTLSLFTVEEMEVEPPPSTPRPVPQSTIMTHPDGSVSTTLTQAVRVSNVVAVEVVTATYWSIVVPLIALSGWLLLSRPAAQTATPQMPPIET